MTADADLSAELAEARRRLAELEASEAERRQGEQWSSVCMYISKMSVAKRLISSLNTTQ